MDEKRDDVCVHLTALDISAILVENRVHFGMTDVHILCVQITFRRSIPWQLIVTTPSGKSIVSNTNDPFVFVDYAGTNLRRRVL